MIDGLKDSLLAASWVEMGWKQEWKHGDHSEGQCSCPGEQWIKVVIKKWKKWMNSGYIMEVVCQIWLMGMREMRKKKQE